MIRAILYRNAEGQFTGYSARGHSDYAEEGYDIVCAAVSVLGGSVLTCVPSDVLVSADTQFEPELWEVYVNPWFVPRIFLHADAASVTLCDAPGGEPLHILPTGGGRELNILADCSEDGWLHVESAWDHVDGYVHVDELPTFKRMR